MNRQEIIDKYVTLRERYNMEDALIAVCKRVAELSFDAGELRAGQINAAVEGRITNEQITAPNKQTFINNLFENE